MKIDAFIHLKSCETTSRICVTSFAENLVAKLHKQSARFVTKTLSLLMEVKF